MAELALVLKGMKGSVVVGAAALYPFPSWQRLLALCPPSQKPKGRERERIVLALLGLWDTTPGYFPGLCVCVSVCKDGYLIAPILVVGRVCNMIQLVCYLSICNTCACVFERKKPRTQLYLCMRVRDCVSDPRPAVSPQFFFQALIA